MMSLLTHSHEAYSKFLKEHDFSSSNICLSSVELLIKNQIKVVILPQDTPSDETLRFLSAIYRNNNMAVVDYAWHGWETKASLVLSEEEYVKLYNKLKEKRITYSARITSDYKIKVSFPDAYTAFTLQFNL